MPVGFLGILTIVFIVLKLTEIVMWSWFWVLSPLIIGVSALLLFVVLVVGGRITVKQRECRHR